MRSQWLRPSTHQGAFLLLPHTLTWSVWNNLQWLQPTWSCDLVLPAHMKTDVTIKLPVSSAVFHWQTLFQTWMTWRTLAWARMFPTPMATHLTWLEVKCSPGMRRMHLDDFIFLKPPNHSLNRQESAMSANGQPRKSCELLSCLLIKSTFSSPVFPSDCRYRATSCSAFLNVPGGLYLELWAKNNLLPLSFLLSEYFHH